MIIIILLVLWFMFCLRYAHNHPPTMEKVYENEEKAKRVITSVAQFATVTTATTAYKLATTKEKKKK